MEKQQDYIIEFNLEKKSTCIAVLGNTGEVIIKKKKKNESSIQSFVDSIKSGLLIGKEAKILTICYPQNTVFDIEDIKNCAKISYHGSSASSPVQISTVVLKELRSLASSLD